MIVLQGVNNEATITVCNNDAGCWDCDNCGGSITH